MEKFKDPSSQKGKPEPAKHLWPKFDLMVFAEDVDINNNQNNMETTNTTNNAPENINRASLEPERITPIIESPNKNLWGKISSGAKEIMSNAYEGIYMTPGLNKVVGKMEIA